MSSMRVHKTAHEQHVEKQLTCFSLGRGLAGIIDRESDQKNAGKRKGSRGVKGRAPRQFKQGRVTPCEETEVHNLRDKRVTALGFRQALEFRRPMCGI
jgi:hypothetical protein